MFDIPSPWPFTYSRTKSGSKKKPLVAWKGHTHQHESSNLLVSPKCRKRYYFKGKYILKEKEEKPASTRGSGERKGYKELRLTDWEVEQSHSTDLTQVLSYMSLLSFLLEEVRCLPLGEKVIYVKVVIWLWPFPSWIYWSTLFAEI